MDVAPGDGYLVQVWNVLLYSGRKLLRCTFVAMTFLASIWVHIVFSHLPPLPTGLP